MIVVVCDENRMVKIAEKRRRYIGEYKRSLIVLDWNDIYYLESYQRKTYVYTALQRYRVQGRLDEEERKLASGSFVRVHQGFVVNLKFVKRMTDFGLVLKGGKEIPVSVRRRKWVTKKLNEY